MSIEAPSPRSLLLAGTLALLCAAQAVAGLAAQRRAERDHQAALARLQDHQIALEQSLAAQRDALQAARAERDARAAAAPAPEIPERYLSVSLTDRSVTLWRGGEPVSVMPVSVGFGNDPEAGAWAAAFTTPRGRRRVEGLVKDPVWIPPDWHYAERSYKTGLPVVAVSEEQPYALGDGSSVEVRGGELGAVVDGVFTAYPHGTDIVAGGAVIQPPIASKQRRYERVLGAYMIDIGDGYAFHGTDRPDSVGMAASHGCMRMRGDNIAALFGQVELGDPVFLY